MLTILEVCDAIHLPKELEEKIAEHVTSEDIIKNKEIYAPSLRNPDNWTAGVQDLIERLGDDPDGSKLLTVMLLCGVDAQKEYEARGIDLHIFTETMKYCSEYIESYYEAYGAYVFEQRRAKWFPRQLSLHEFRIQVLEYEMVEEDGEKQIYIHIPPKTDLSRSAIRKSYLAARNFFSTYFPEYAQAAMYCDSWLLSPALPLLLPPTSKIVGFQKEFTVDHTDYETDSFVEWVFKRRDLPKEQLPEDTSLQRKMKEYLLQGGKVGWSHGKLKDNPWA